MPHRPYHGAIITCVDGLWTEKIRKVAIEILGGDILDFFTRPGGVKQMHPDCPIALDQIDQLCRVSIGLHGVKQIVLCNHWNCGAYGGSRAFAGPTAERDAHLEHLWRSAEFLRDNICLPHSEQAVKIHPVLLLPMDLDQPFSGDPNDCTHLVL